MKKLLNYSIILLSIFLSFSAYAQFPIDEETGDVKYTEVIKLDSMSQDEIYNKAKLWMVSTLKSGDNMVELNGEESDQIIGTGNLHLDSLYLFGKGKNEGYSKNASLNFKFIVQCKEGRLKYSVENFLLIYTSGAMRVEQTETTIQNPKPPTAYTSPNIKRFKEKTPIYINRKLRQLEQNFTEFMVNSDSDDW